MDSRARQGRISPNFTVEELGIVDRLRGRSSRAAFVRMAIEFLVAKPSSAREDLARVPLPPLPEKGAPRIDVRGPAELFRKFEVWLDRTLPVGVALRAFLRQQQALRDAREAASQGEPPKAPHKTAGARGAAAKSASLPGPASPPRSKDSSPKARGVPAHGSSPGTSSATRPQPPARTAGAGEKRSRPGLPLAASATSSATAVPPKATTRPPRTGGRPQAGDPIADKVRQQPGQLGRVAPLPRFPSPASVSAPAGMAGVHQTREERDDTMYTNDDLSIDVTTADRSDTSRLLRALNGSAEITVVPGFTPSTQREILTLLGGLDDGDDFRLLIGAEISENEAVDDDENDDDDGWDDADVDWTGGDDDDGDDEDQEVALVGVRDPGTVATRVESIIRAIDRDGNFDVRKHIGVRREDRLLVHLVEVEGSFD